MTDIKIEAGKYYRTRDGQKVGPMEVPPTGRWSDAVESSCDDRGWYKGGVYWRDTQHDNDLVAEWRDAPDLTAITTPFGLLDRETQEALKAHGGPYEIWQGNQWGKPAREREFDGWYAYRVKPARPKPRDLWLIEWGVDNGPVSSIERTEWDAAKAVSSLVTNGHRNVRLSRFAEVLPE